MEAPGTKGHDVDECERTHGHAMEQVSVQADCSTVVVGDNARRVQLPVID